MIKVVRIGIMKAPIDSVAPIVGTFLEPLLKDDIKKGNLEIIGNIWKPVHALNLLERIKDINKDDYVLVIDASIAGRNSEKSIGDIIVRHTSIKPGSGVGKKHLPEVGDDSVTIVMAKEPVTSLWIDPKFLIEIAHQATFIVATILAYKLRNPEVSLKEVMEA